MCSRTGQYAEWLLEEKARIKYGKKPICGGLDDAAAALPDEEFCFFVFFWHQRLVKLTKSDTFHTINIRKAN